jgi:DNA mismatch repair protein PMS2
MFFVNARPCGLPQVAKVFNEVYKSYNISQSPFIFANITLDTSRYPREGKWLSD